MKQFAIIKVGYTAGIYGCTGEYFNCIYTDEAGLNSFCFVGLFGVDRRVSGAMEKRGYKEVFISSDYGKMARRYVQPIFIEEHNLDDVISRL